jgi:putative SOS response-associated peptidase YedK
MCNLYSMTKGQQAVREFTRATRDTAGNLPTLPAIYPDAMAPVVFMAADGERELTTMRWGMPGPPQFGGGLVTNMRNTASTHWRRWLGPQNRCLVPVASFCEWQVTQPCKRPFGSLGKNHAPCSRSPAFGLHSGECGAPRLPRPRESASCSVF